MISLRNVVKKFGNKTAVDGVSFEVKKGENVVLLGTSGCGKTTTLRMINRLTEISSGEIKVDGKNIREIPPEELRRNIGYVLQHNGLFPHYTIAENIAIVPRLLKWPARKNFKTYFRIAGAIASSQKHFIPVSATIKWRPTTKSWSCTGAGSRSAFIIDG